MFLVTIDTEQCGGCGQCAEACPSQIIAMVENKAQVTGEPSECLGCGSCTIVCSSSLITVDEY